MTFKLIEDGTGGGLVDACYSREGRTAWFNVRGLGGLMVERTKGANIAGPWFMVERGEGEAKVWFGRVSVLLTSPRRL
jgi:hypothetical protein